MCLIEACNTIAKLITLSMVCNYVIDYSVGHLASLGKITAPALSGYITVLL